MTVRSDTDIAAEVIRRFEVASGNRTNYESHWEEIARRVLPGYAGTFNGSGSAHGGAPLSFNDALAGVGGNKKTEEMIDATAALALPRFAAVSESLLTPRNQKWHRLITRDKVLKRNRSVRVWYEDTRDLLFQYRYAANANFQGQAHEGYMSLGAFGTGNLFTDALDRRYGGGLRYRQVHLGESYFLENHQGIVDTCLRKFPLTARQAVQKWGSAKLPAKIVEAAADAKKAESSFFFIHCVKPREEAEGYDPGRLDVRGMQFASYYVSVEEKRLVQQGGYNTFPYAIGRYVQAPGELYGRSPAMLALSSIKTLNEQKKAVLKQGHRVVDPVLLAHDDGAIDTFSLKPGSINTGGVNAEGRPLIHTLPTGNLAVGDKMMDMERAVINDAFLITLFQILVDSPQMTATEVLERAREKGMLLGPTMGRLQSEYLGPLIDRELDVLASQNLIPEMPPILKDAAGEYDVEYDSPLSRAQRAEEAAGLFRTVDWLTPNIQITQNPEPLDWIDWDTVVPEVMEIQAVPQRWVRSAEKVEEIRAQRAEQAQTQTLVEAAPAAAAVMKTMGGKK